MKNLILALFIFSFFSCANTNKHISKENSTVNIKQDTTINKKELTMGKLNNGDQNEEQFECIENKDTTFLLCTKTTEGTVMQPRNSIQYTVYDAKTKEVVYEGSIHGGFVKWYDKNRLEIYQQLGIPMEGMTQDDMIKIYDVVEKTTHSKSSIEKSSTEKNNIEKN